MRRRPVGERLEQEAELAAGLLVGQPDHVENPLLHLGFVDTERAASDLRAVEHDVVRPRERLSRALLEVGGILLRRRREGVVDGCPTLVAAVELDPLEHGRVDDPDELPRVVVDEAAPLPHLEAGGCEQAERVGASACCEEDTVSGTGARLRREAGTLVLGQVLGDRAAELTVLLHQHVRETLGATRAGPVLPGVELLACLSGSARHDDGADVVVVGARLEHPERRVREVLGEVDELAAEAQVGTVDAVAAHRLVVRHPRDRQRHLVTDELAPQPGDERLDQRLDVLGVAEAHLDVELGELRLPVRPEVLVAEAAGDLEVALHAGDHEQLLEQLR